MGWYNDTVKKSTPKEGDFVTRFMNSMPKEQPSNMAVQSPQTIKPIAHNPVIDQTTSIGGYKFGSNALKVRQNDNPIAKAGKGIVNFVAGIPQSVGSAFGLGYEGLKQAAIQTSSLIQGKGLQPYKGPTSLTQEIGGAPFAEYAKSHPKTAGIIQMVGDTVADPTMYIGAGGAKAIANTTKGLEAVGAANAKILSKLKAKIPLTATEVSTVQKTPELLQLPGMKQHLMLEAPKPTTPKVIEMLPPKPTIAELKILKKPVKMANADIAKDYLYHGTSEGSFRKIRKEGMNVQNLLGEDSGKHLYLSNNETYAKSYADRKGGSSGGRVIRVLKTPDMIADTNTIGKAKNMDFKTLNSIPVENIEVKTPNGWESIQKYYNEDFGIAKIENPKTPVGTSVSVKTPVAEIPIEIRSFSDVGSPKVKAYQFNHPELRSEIQTEAGYIQTELKGGVKGERFPIKDEQGYITGWSGTTKSVSESVQRIQDSTNASYKEINNALDAIIKDHGAENTALAKRIELVIDDNLSKGVNRFEGFAQVPDQLYIDKKAAIKPQLNNGNIIPDALGSQAKTDIAAKQNMYETATQNLLHNVPEQYRKENPFTVSRSTVPQKVQPAFAKELLQPNVETAANKTAPSITMRNISKDTVLPTPQSKIILNAKVPRKSFKEAWDNFYTRTWDTAHPGKKVGDEFYTKATNSKSVGGIVNHNLTASLVDVNGNRIGDSLKQVAEQIPKGKEDDFWTYMSQRHNIDRARENKPVQANYTPEMSVEAVKRYELANPVYKQTGDNITKWIDDFMQTWGVDAGTVNKEVYAGLRKTYKSYFPTQRDFSTLENAIPDGMGSKFANLSSPIKKATGSERDIKNPIENIMNLVDRTVRTAKYNEVGKGLLDSVRSAPEKLKPLAEVISVKDGMFSNLDNIVTVLEDGKPVYLKINDKPLLDMLTGLPKTTITVPGLNRVISGFKRLITQDNPVFAVRNIARDVPTYLVNGTERNPIKALGNLGGAIKDIVTNSPNLQRYEGVGGGGANFLKGGNVSKAAAELTGKGNLFKKVIKAPIRAIERFNNLTETAPRLAEFNTVLKKTGSTDKALFAANDVTVNFSRGGDITKALDRNLVPYLNAGMQGLDKLFRQFKNHPIATILKGATVITAPTLILDQVNKNNPKYQQMDNRTKDNYYLIPNGDTFIKIPKSRELGVLFSSLIERVLKGDFKGFGSTVVTNFAPTNPVENNIGSPIALNLKSNKDFAGRAIVPLDMVMDKRSPKLQYDETTSEIAKKIGELTNLSPKQIDYVIKSYTGVIGQLGLPLTVKQNYQGGNTFQKLLKPLTTQFTADPLYSNNILNDFYTNMDKLSQKATDRNMTENLPSKFITTEEVMKSNFTKASTQISDINKLIKKETDINKVRELKQKILDIANSTNLMLK